MIPRAFITAWRSEAPWTLDAQVEQDLVISRALVEIFRVRELARSLAFRGGTCLYKLHLTPAARYSEDIDLVQIRAEPIGDMLDQLRTVLNPWLGEPRRQFAEGRVTMSYRFASEDSPPLRLKVKIEVNSREHFTELGHTTVPFSIENPWFAGAADVTTFELEELLGTKLRALYQRRKGRDLFDLWHAMKERAVGRTAVVACFERYMRESDQSVTRAEFEENLERKRHSPDFRDDVRPLLRPGVAWDFDPALDDIRHSLVALLPGEPWRGER